MYPPKTESRSVVKKRKERKNLEDWFIIVDLLVGSRKLYFWGGKLIFVGSRLW